MSIITETCCTKPPVDAAHPNEGKHEKLGDLDVFFAGPEDAKVAVLCFYDIFGYHPSTQEFVVRLGKQGIRAALPDLCHGNAWPLSKFPLTDAIKPEFFKWIQTSFNYDAWKADVKKVVEHLRSKGASKVITLGFCAGAKAATRAAAEEGFVDGVVGLHPSFWNDEDAAALKTPVLCVAAKDDPDFTSFFNAIHAPYKALSENYRFDDVEHGFCAARGDWSGGVATQRAQEANNLAGKFIHKLAQAGTKLHTKL